MLLAAAIIIPCVMSITYQKATGGIPEPEETNSQTVTEPEDAGSEDETGTEDDPSLATEAEPAEETEKTVKVYTEKPQNKTAVDRYIYYSPAFDSEWNEEEERVLGPLMEDESEEEPETEPETEPAVTKAPETEPAVTKAPETEPPVTKAPETEPVVTKAPETTAEPEDDPIYESVTVYTEDETEAGPTNSKYEINGTGKYLGCDATYIKVYNKSTGNYTDMLMGDYLVGVIAAEMPVKFDIEALKAQAVASRTFTIYKAMSDSYYHSSAHGSRGADVCTNSGHCQAYLSYESALKSWSSKDYVDRIYEKIKRAVLETSGLVLTYNGKPIEAVYHASSYGRTDSMANVWGGSNPCLVGATTPETLDTSYVYSTEVFTAAEVKKLVLSINKNAEFPADPADWMKITLNSNGRVKTLQIGSASLSGQTCKGLFELSSNNFKVSYDKSTGKFTFEVYGWGHGVGLSQYGAGIYAEQGKDFEFILKHYYNNAELTLYY